MLFLKNLLTCHFVRHRANIKMKEIEIYISILEKAAFCVMEHRKNLYKIILWFSCMNDVA